ncbi:deacetylase, partial [Acidobacteria bacterium AH-259-L09]|nr:deacetylase [Acidobacteria bacterium AH-259-L09]
MVGNRSSLRPDFLVTVDVEGDNLWSAPRKITTNNAAYLERFESLCESYGLKPTYLVDYEMANSSVFVDFGKDILQERRAEIGMHLHAWNTPPLVPLTQDDFRFLPYLFEYPANVMREKVSVMTELLESTFDVEITSHRAGRWGLNEVYAHILIEKGYCVDCSVTPHVSWSRDLGDPKQSGGADYSDFPDEAYCVDLNDISRPGYSNLLEIPVTIFSAQSPFRTLLHLASRNLPKVRALVNQYFPLAYWLRPNGRNRKNMLDMVRRAIREKRRYLQLVLHSSEVMPGGSPSFPGAEDIEALYADLEVVFQLVNRTCRAVTLKEFH